MRASSTAVSPVPKADPCVYLRGSLSQASFAFKPFSLRAYLRLTDPHLCFCNNSCPWTTAAHSCCPKVQVSQYAKRDLQRHPHPWWISASVLAQQGMEIISKTFPVSWIVKSTVPTREGRHTSQPVYGVKVESCRITGNVSTLSLLIATFWGAGADRCGYIRGHLASSSGRTDRVHSCCGCQQASEQSLPAASVKTNTRWGKKEIEISTSCQVDQGRRGVQRELSPGSGIH